MEANIPGRILQKTDLFSQANLKSKSLGKLPQGSIVTLIGQQSGDFWRVEVELKGDKVLEGWVDKKMVQLKGGAMTLDRMRTEKESAPERVIVPRDEILLMQRDLSFNYGLQVGGNAALISNDGDSLLRQGFGILVGGYASLFLTQKVPLRFEVNYSQFNGTSAEPNDTTFLGFGFMEVGLVPSYILNPVELFAGIHYSYGLSLQDIPTSLSTGVQGASDLSGVWLQAGAGYRIEFSKYAALVGRFRYCISFSARNFFFQGFAGAIALEFQG